MLPSVKAKVGGSASLPSQEEAKQAAQANLAASANTGASVGGSASIGGITGFQAVTSVTSAAISKYDDPDTDDDDEERKELKNWKKRERQLIYEREDYKNQLLEMTIMRDKLQEEVTKKDIRIKELMELILKYREDLKELELHNAKLELDCENFKAQIDENLHIGDINAKLKLALAAQEKQFKKIDLENDQLEKLVKDLKGSKETLKKQLNQSRRQLDALMKELEAFKAHSNADYGVIMLEKTLARIDQGIHVSIDDTTELNERVKLLSDITPGKLPEEKAKALSLGKNLMIDLEAVKKNGEEITKEVQPLRKQLNETHKEPLKLKNAVEIRAKADELNERISDFNDTLSMARTKRIPDFKANVADIEAKLKKELRLELQNGSKEGLSITGEREGKINSDEIHLVDLEKKQSEGIVGASGEKLEVLQKLGRDIKAANGKVYLARTSNEISKKLLNFVDTDTDHEPESIEVLAKTRYVDLPRALQMNKETDRLRSISFEGADDLGKVLDSTLKDKADELLINMRKKFDGKGPKGLDELRGKLDQLHGGIGDVQIQIDNNMKIARTPEQKASVEKDQNLLDVPFKKEHGQLSLELEPLQKDFDSLKVRVAKLGKGGSIKDITKLKEDVDNFEDKVNGNEKHTDDLIERLKALKDMLKNKGIQQEMEGRLDDELKKKDVLDKKNKALRLLANKEKPLIAGDRDVAHLDEHLRPVEKKFALLCQWTEPERLADHKKEADVTVKDARSTIQQAKKDIVATNKKLAQIRTTVTDIDPEKLGGIRANDLLNKSGEELKKLEPELHGVDKIVGEAKEKEGKAKAEVDGLEVALKASLNTEIETGLAENTKVLGRAGETLGKCDVKIDLLNKKATDLFTHVPPKSAEAKKLNGYKVDLLGKADEARNIDKRRHKEESDQKRMRLRLQDKPEIEPLMTVLADERKDAEDCKGVEKDARILYESLGPIEAGLNTDGDLNAQNKLDELKRRLKGAKKDAKDLDQKCNDFDREADDLGKILRDAIPGTKDPEMKKKLEAGLLQLKDPLVKEAKLIEKDKPNWNDELGKIEKAIQGLDPNNPDPHAIDDLLDRVIKADEEVKSDEIEIDALKAKLRPLDKLGDQAHRGLGDDLRGLELNVKAFSDDLKDLDKKLERIELKDQKNVGRINKLKKDPFKDKERDIDITEVAKEEIQEKERLNHLFSERDHLQSELNKCLKKLEDARVNPTPVDPLHAEVKELNDRVDFMNDSSNQLDTDVEVTRDKLEDLYKKYYDKKRMAEDLRRDVDKEKQDLTVLKDVKAPAVLKRLNELDKKFKGHPQVGDAGNQAKLDDLKNQLKNKLDDVNLVPKDTEVQIGLDGQIGGVLNSMPTQVVKFSELENQRGKLTAIEGERINLEARLRDADDFYNQAELDSEPIYLMDDLGKVNRNVRRGDEIQKKLDRAEVELGKVNGLLDGLDKKADEAVKNNPKLKAQADEAKKKKIPIRQRAAQLDKLRDDIERARLDAISDDDPRKAKEVNRLLDELDKKAINLNVEVDKLRVEADKLDDDFDKQNDHSDKERKVESAIGLQLRLADDLEKKIAKLNATITSVEPLQKAIENNPDYLSMQDANRRLKDKCEEHKKANARVAKEKKRMDGEVQEINKLLPHIEKMDAMELDDLILQIQEIEPRLQHLHKEVDGMQAWQDDKRERLGDVEIPHSLEVKRPQDIGEVQRMIDAISKRHDANKLNLKEQIPLGGSPQKRSPAQSVDKKLEEDALKLQTVSGKLEKFKAAVPLFQQKLKGMNLNKEEPAKLAPHVKDIADLGVEIRKLKEEIDTIGSGMDSTQFHLDELRKQEAKKATQDAFNKMDELRKAGHAKDKKNDSQKEVDEEGIQLKARLRDLDDLNKELVPVEKRLQELIRITDPRLPKQKKDCDGIVKDARSKVNVAEKHGKEVTKKLEPIAQQINSADPTKMGPIQSNNQIEKALGNLKKMRPELEKLNEEFGLARNGVDKAKKEVGDLEDELMRHLNKEVTDGLHNNDKRLESANDLLKKCDVKIDDLNIRADEGIRRFPPKSEEGKKFDGYKKELRLRDKECRDIYARKHKEDADQTRMKDRHSQNPGLEPMVRLAADVDEGRKDCEGVLKDSDELYRKLHDLDQLMNADEKKGKQNKLDDLRRKLVEARKDLRDVKEKSDDFDREAKDVEEALDVAIPGMPDPAGKKQLQDLKRKLNDPLKKEAVDIRKATPPNEKVLADIDLAISKLDPEHPDPAKVDDLRDLLNDAHYKIAKDEKHIDELRAKLRPIDKAADDAHKALGDSLRGADRSLKSLDDDLRDLERKGDRIKKKLDHNEKLLADEKKDTYKDKERDDELVALMKEHDSEKNEYLDMKAHTEDLRRNYGDLKKRLDTARKDPSKASPEDIQRDAEKINDLVNKQNDRGNRIESEVDDTLHKIEGFQRKYNDKKRRVADANRKADDELRDVKRLNATLIPDALTKLEDAKRRMEKLPPTNPGNQKKADDLLASILGKIKEIKGEVVPDAKKLENGTTGDRARLMSIPSKIVPSGEVTEIVQDLETIDVKRVECEHKLKEPERMADDGNKLADDLIRLNIGNKDLNNKLKAKDLEVDLRDAQKKLDETLDHLNKANEAGAKAVKVNPANKMRADVLRKAADGIRAKEQELQKKKDELAKRIGACKSAPPENAGQAEKDLEKLEKEIDDLHKDINVRLEQARNLNPDFDKEGLKLEKVRSLNLGVEKYFKLEDDLEKKLAKLNKCIATMEPLQKAIEGNPDYPNEQDSNKRLKEKLDEMKVKSERVAKQKKKLDRDVKEIQKLLPHINEMDVLEVEDLNYQMEDVLPTLEKLHKEVDEMQSQYDKRRVKLGDVHIPQNINTLRPQDVKEVEKRIKALDDTLKGNRKKLEDNNEPKGSAVEKKVAGDENKLKDISKRLDTLKAQIPVLGKKHLGADLTKEEPSKLAPIVGEVANLGVEIRKLNGDLDGIDGSMGDITRHTEELLVMARRKKDAEIQDKMDELTKQGKVAKVKTEGVKDVEGEGNNLKARIRDMANLSHLLEPIIRKNGELKRLTDPRLPEDKKRTDGFLQRTKQSVDTAEQHGRVMVKKLEPIAESINTADPSVLGAVKSEQQVQGALNDLNKLKPEIAQLNKEFAEAHVGVDKSRTEVDDLEEKLKKHLNNEIVKGLNENDQDLKRAKDTLGKCDVKIDRLNLIADEAVRRFPPKSKEAQLFDAHKANLRGKAVEARNIDKRKHKEDADQEKMRERVAMKPGVELLVRLADDVYAGHKDCEGVRVDSEILYKSLCDLEKDMERDSKSGKRNKLDDLRKLLYDAKKDLADVDDKCFDFHREAKDLEDSLNSAIESTKDPSANRQLQDLKKKLEVPLKKEAGEIHGDVPPRKKLLAQIEADIGTLDTENPDPAKVDDLRDLLMGADRKIKADEKHIDELRAKLRPIDKACDDAHKALGDSIRNAERDMKGLDDDLRDLERKADRIKKKLEHNDELIATERKDPYKDKERDDELNGIQKEHDGERNEYLDMKKKAEDLRRKYGELRKNLDVAKKDPTKVSPEELQIEIEKVNISVNAENDRANQIEVDVDETKDKLDHFVRKYDDKKKKYQDAMRRCADEMRDLDRLNKSRIPDVRTKLNNSIKRMQKLPATSPINQKRADDLRNSNQDKLKELQGQIAPEGERLRSAANNCNDILKRLPSKVITRDDINGVNRDLSNIHDKRIELEHRLKDPDSLADEANRLADELIRLTMGNKDLNNKLKGKDMDADLRDAQKKLDCTVGILVEVNSGAEEVCVADPSFRPTAQTLLKAAAPIRGREEDLQKAKDDLEKRVSAAKSAPPENAETVQKELQKLEGAINGLHTDIDKNQDDARKLKLDYEKEKDTHDKNRRIIMGLDEQRRLNDDLIKKIRRLRGHIDSQVELNRVMQKNPDYDYEQPELVRFGDKLQNFTNQADRDDSARKRIDGVLGTVRAKVGRGKLFGIELDNSANDVDAALKELKDLHIDVDGMQASLDKKRKKQGDHKINDHIFIRPQESDQCQKLLDKAKDKLQRLKSQLNKPDLATSSPTKGKDVMQKRSRENEKLLNQIQKDLEPVHQKAIDLKPKFEKRDFPNEECRLAVGPVQEIMRLGIEIQKIKERIEEVDGDIEQDLAMTQSPEQKDRMIEDMLMKVKTQDLEADYLKKKNEFEIKERLIDRPLAVDLKSVQLSLIYLEDLNQRINRLAQVTHIRKPADVPQLQAECQDDKRRGVDLDKRIRNKAEDLKPLREFVRTSTYPKHKPETIQDKIDELKRENVVVEHLNEETDKLAKDVDLLHRKELQFRERMIKLLRTECTKELTGTKTTLKKVDEKALKAQIILDELKLQIEGKMRVLDTQSVDYKSMVSLKKDQESRQYTMNDLACAKHKCHGDQSRMDEHMKEKLGLEPLVLLGDEEVPQHREDVNKLAVEQDRLLDDLMRFQKRLDDAKRQQACNRLADLKKRLEHDKMSNDELGYKLNNLDRDANDILQTADQLKGNVKDPMRRKRLEAIANEIKDPILRETYQLKADQSDNIGKKQLTPLEKKIYALDAKNPNEAKIDELIIELELAEDRMKGDNQRADELREKLRPLKNQVEDVERSLGDKKSDLERTMRNLNDDLRELDKRIALSDKNLKGCNRVVGEIEKLEPRDAERNFDIAELDKRMDPTSKKLETLKKDRETLRGRLDGLRVRVNKIDPEKPDAKEISALDSDLGLMSSDIVSALNTGNERVRDCEARKEEADDLQSKHHKKIIDRNETIAKANFVEEKLKDVERQIGRVTDNLNSSQQLLNRSTPGPDRDDLQKKIDAERVKHGATDKLLKLKFTRFDEITRDLPRMDKVKVTSEDLRRKQNELSALTADLNVVEVDLTDHSKDSDDLMRLSRKKASSGKAGEIEDLRKRADNDQSDLNRGRDNIKLVKKKIELLKKQCGDELGMSMTKSVHEKVFKLQTDLNGDIIALDKLEKTAQELQAPHMNGINKGVRDIDPLAPDVDAKVADMKKRMDDIEPKIAKLNIDIDRSLDKCGKDDELLGRYKRLADKEKEKEDANRVNKAIGDAATFAKDFERLQAKLRGKIDGHKRLLKALTDNPDYHNQQGVVQSEKAKLKALEKRLQDLIDENDELEEQIGPMLRREIDCDPAELEERIRQMKEKLDEDNNEINDFDEELDALRGREGDENVPALIKERENELIALNKRIVEVKASYTALDNKLKHQDEHCDLPGELDDMIRDQVREDLKKCEIIITNAEKSRVIAESDLEKIRAYVKGKELKAISADHLAVSVELLFKLRHDIEQIYIPLREADASLKKGNSKLAGLDLDKMVFDRENDLGNMERRIEELQIDERHLGDLQKTLENAERAEDDQSVLKDIHEQLDDLKRDTTVAEKKKDEIKEKMEEIKLRKENMVKQKQDTKMIADLIARCDEQELALIFSVDTDITANNKRIDDLERRLGKITGKVAAIDLETKHDDSFDKLNELYNEIKEMETNLGDMKGWIAKPVSSEEKKVAVEEVSSGIPKAEEELNDMKAERDKIKKAMDSVRDEIKKNPKPRTFRQAKPPYKDLKEIDIRLHWVGKARVNSWNKNYDELKKAREACEKEKPRVTKYVAKKKDPVDAMIGDYINDTGLQVPIRRLGNGYYYFGSRKIFAKIINGKLVIRVGGGYMSIDEFVEHYAQAELNRQEQLAFAKDIADTTKGAGDRRSTVLGIQKAKKSLANRRTTTKVDEDEETKLEAPPTAGDLSKMLRDMERKGAASPSGGYRRISMLK